MRSHEVCCFLLGQDGIDFVHHLNVHRQITTIIGLLLPALLTAELLAACGQCLDVGNVQCIQGSVILDAQQLGVLRALCWRDRAGLDPVFEDGRDFCALRCDARFLVRCLLR